MSLIAVYPHRLPVAFVRGEGCWLYDEAGKPYLDALSGLGVCSLGHCHPAVTGAVQRQAATLLHTSNTYHVPQQARLASQLCTLSGLDQAFFANSGAEAIEASLKLAWLHAHEKGIRAPVVIALAGSYHGRTLGALHASGVAHLRAECRAVGMAPLAECFVHVPLNGLEALKEAVRAYDKRIAAILFEPVQGDGGIRPTSPEFLAAIRQLCDAQAALMIADEVQTGLCRTGRWFGCQHAGVLPDVMALSKALGNGVPIGAYLVRSSFGHLLAGRHGSTFAGNPLACAAAQAVVDTLRQESLADRAAALGARLLQRLQEALGAHPEVLAIRGLGLMLGIELRAPCRPITRYGLENGLLFNVVSNSTIRLLPPLILSEAEADEIVNRLLATLTAFFP